MSHSIENGIRTNKQGLDIIGKYESCRRDAYKCPAGRWTQGIGTTSNIKHGKLKSNDEIAKDFTFAIKQAEQCLNTYADGKSLPDNTFSAFTSFTFNVGCTKAKDYTVYKLLKERKYKEACEMLPKYSYATVDGKKTQLSGLIKRRNAEKNLCLIGL